MGYRIKEHKPEPKRRRTVQDTTTPSGMYVNQGVFARFAFPCWYQEVHPPVPVDPHNRHYHDYVGWPSPMHPGHSCQLWVPTRRWPYINIDVRHLRPYHYISLAGITPIHLLGEGYTGVEMYIDGKKIEDDPIFNAYIDETQDWVVMAEVMFPYCDSGKPEPHDIAIFAVSDEPRYRDLVVHSKIIVLPTLALPHSEEDEEEI